MFQRTRNPAFALFHNAFFLRKDLFGSGVEKQCTTEKGLIILIEIFKHSNTKTTTIYLGWEKEIQDTYQNS